MYITRVMTVAMRMTLLETNMHTMTTAMITDVVLKITAFYNDWEDDADARGDDNGDLRCVDDV